MASPLIWRRELAVSSEEMGADVVLIPSSCAAASVRAVRMSRDVAGEYAPVKKRGCPFSSMEMRRWFWSSRRESSESENVESLCSLLLRVKR